VELHIQELLANHREPDPSGDLEAAMKRVSLVLSLIGFGLMVAGLVLMLLAGATFSSTGTQAETSALAPFPLSAWTQASPGLVVTSAGITLLALLPIVRVLLALRLYLRGRNLRDAAATVIVFLELLLSIRAGG
jgi:uncharacterized membrane protein